MNRMQDWIDALTKAGFKPSAFVAGLAGGLVNVLVGNSDKPWWHRLMNMFAGAVTAAYLTTLIAHFMSLERYFENALAFLIGSLGLAIMDKLLEFIEKNDIPTLIRLIFLKRK